jgi:hypothetical protein
MRNVGEHIGALDEAGRILDRALSAPKRKTGPARRWRADAELFRHIIAAYRFELGEARAAAQEIRESDWDDDKTCPGIADEIWIPRGSDPARVRKADHRGAWQPERGKKIAEARRGFLRRYAGTPFGEIVARNEVVTYRMKRYIKVEHFDEGPPDAGTPSESAARKSPTPRAGPGSSSGGGASSGR